MTCPRCTRSPTLTLALLARICTYSTNKSPPLTSYVETSASVVVAHSALAFLSGVSGVEQASSFNTIEFHLNRFDTAIPVSVFSSHTSITSPSPTASTGVPSGHLKSTACKFPLKKCVNSPPSFCVHKNRSPRRGNPTDWLCVSLGFGCIDHARKSLSIRTSRTSLPSSRKKHRCAIERGGTRHTNVVTVDRRPSLSIVTPCASDLFPFP
mmetsp:Transcript_3843/g.14819  ORF Transcript_3843/g.14819 Transcript_3843/m.14819 type:complete len:210 (-) Transcript_3843:399-1028(-)